MTPRQQEAKKWREKGLTQREIAEKMGISRARVSHLLRPEKKKAYMKAYRQTPKCKAYQNVYQKAYRQTPKGKAYGKAYQQTPQYKAYQKAYRLRKKQAKDKTL